MHRRKRLALLGSLAGALLFSAVASAETPERPAWRALPEKTTVTLRLPNARAFGKALKERTRLGRLLLSKERRARAKALVRKLSPGGLDRLTGKLEKYGIAPDDLPKLLAGPAGGALTFAKRDSRPPVAMGLAWMEPGEELATRLLDAVKRAVAETEDTAHPVKRVDREIAGHDVMHLSVPQTGPKQGTGLDLPENFGELSKEERRKAVEKAQKKQKQTEEVVIDRTNVFLSRLGGRVVLATTFPQSKERVRKRLKKGKPIDWKEMTGVEAATGVFARFLQNQTGSGGGFAERVLSTAGLPAALPDGQPLFEVYTSAASAIDWWRAAQGGAKQDSFVRLKRLGLHTVGAAAFRTALTGNVLRSGGFLSAPTPRKGLVTLLEQPTLPAKPPGWVASDVLRYTHFSLDLGALYRRIKKHVLEEGGKPVRAMYRQMEKQFRKNIQSSPVELLSALGHRHTVLGYQPHLVEREVPSSGSDDGGKAKKKKLPQNRAAFVWEVQDEQVWKRAMQFLGGMLAGSGMERTQEQGFTGWRRSGDSGMEWGLFLGRGHLVVAIGEGVAERVLSMLRNPAKGDGSLRNSDTHKKAAELIEPRPGVLYSLTDAARAMQSFRPIVLAAMRQAGQGGDKAAEAMSELMPSTEKLQGAISVSTGQLYLTDQGMVLESASELPPPEK